MDIPLTLKKTLKKNQGGLYQRVNDLFKEVLSNSKLEDDRSNYTLEELGHGRSENRRYQILNNISDKGRFTRRMVKS